MIYGGHFDPDKLNERLKALEEKTNESDFWSNRRESEKVISEINSIKRKKATLDSVDAKIYLMR